MTFVGSAAEKVGSLRINVREARKAELSEVPHFLYVFTLPPRIALWAQYLQIS